TEAFPGEPEVGAQEAGLRQDLVSVQEDVNGHLAVLRSKAGKIKLSQTGNHDVGLDCPTVSLAQNARRAAGRAAPGPWQLVCEPRKVRAREGEPAGGSRVAWRRGQVSKGSEPFTVVAQHLRLEVPLVALKGGKKALCRFLDTSLETLLAVHFDG